MHPVILLLSILAVVSACPVEEGPKEVQKMKSARMPVDEVNRFSEETFRHDTEEDKENTRLGKPTRCACRCASCGSCISATIPCIEFLIRGCYPNCTFDVVECMARARVNFSW